MTGPASIRTIRMLCGLLMAMGATAPVAGLVAQTAPAPTAQVASGAPPSVSPSDQRIRFWQAQVARDPEYWASLNGLAAAYAQKARETGEISYYQLAEAALKQSLASESTHVESAPAWTQLATVHLSEHEFRQAAEDAKKAIALNPRELMPYPYAGDAELEMGDYPEAAMQYEHLAAPDDGKPHPGLRFLAYSHSAGLAWIKGDVAGAKDDLAHASALAVELHMPAENIAWTEFMAGEQEFQTGDLAAAEKAETAALAAYPRYYRALAAMGQIRAAQGRLPEAIAFYKQAIAIIPLPLYAAALGDVYAASGDAKNAEKQYALVEFIGKLSEINRQVFNRELALFYADHDRHPAEALTLAERELAVRHDVYTSDALAWALLKNHQVQRAEDTMKQALRMGTRDPMLEFHAGMIAATAGDRAGAARHLQQALAINPHFHVLFAEQARSTLASLGYGTGSQPASQVAVSAAPVTHDQSHP